MLSLLMVGLCRSARSPCGPCYTGHVRPGLHVPRACKGMVLWPPTGTILPSETVCSSVTCRQHHGCILFQKQNYRSTITCNYFAATKSERGTET